MTLKDIREKIDLIDDELITLIKKRINLLKDIIIIKHDQGISVLDKDREEQILSKADNLDLLYRDTVRGVLSTLIDKSRHLQIKLNEYE